MKLENQVALVTGGSKGLGYGFVQSLAKEGAKVVFCGRTKEKNDAAVTALKEMGYDVYAIQCDVSKSDQVRAMFQQIKEQFGRLDILVNNAAALGSNPQGWTNRKKWLDIVAFPNPKVSLEITKNMSDEVWESFIQNNLNSVFYCTREALKIMEDQHYGRIINIVSVAGISALNPHMPHYSAAKGGIVAFTRALSVEVAGAGINVNAVAPGMCAMDEPGWWDGFLKGIGEEHYQHYLQLIPLGRFGQVKEITGLVTFLASEEASYITGQIIPINGGMC